MRGASGLLAIMLIGIARAQDGESADEFYTSLKRSVDAVEGHPASFDAAADARSMYAAGRLAGIFQGMEIHADWGRKTPPCVAGGASGVSLSRIYIKYLDAHPIARNASFPNAAALAIFDAYPCLRPRT